MPQLMQSGAQRLLSGAELRPKSQLLPLGCPELDCAHESAGGHPEERQTLTLKVGADVTVSQKRRVVLLVTLRPHTETPGLFLAL